MTKPLDAIIIGAGAAGLAAARDLKQAGKQILVLEARERIGGRVLTTMDAHTALPIELGAEFVHGEAKETMRLLDEAGMVTVPVVGAHYRSDRHHIEPLGDMFKRIGRVFKKMKTDRKQDRSFQEFLDEKPGGFRLRQERELAAAFVRGFNAADPWYISERALAQQGNPAEGAQKSARVLDGYTALIDIIAEPVRQHIQLQQHVHLVLWENGHVQVETATGVLYQARSLITTIPLPHLQRHTINFEPDVVRIRAAADQLVMGHVVRVTFVLRERVWEAMRKMDDVVFIHTPRRTFNVWWTQHPLRAPLITGWSGGPPAAELEGRGKSVVEETAVRELAAALLMRRARLEPLIDAIYYHDWSADPYSLGAYSYIGVGGVQAPKQLTRPVESTLLFAGEATDSENSGTVEGAIASGKRAAQQCLKLLA
ncbi:MAG TPA: NAD(P)/FAD-dependent oxidoreductase [Longimicrobiales bacterium]